MKPIDFWDKKERWLTSRDVYDVLDMKIQRCVGWTWQGLALCMASRWGPEQEQPTHTALKIWASVSAVLLRHYPSSFHLFLIYSQSSVSYRLPQKPFRKTTAYILLLTSLDNHRWLPSFHQASGTQGQSLTWRSLCTLQIELASSRYRGPVPHDASYYAKCMFGGVLACGITHAGITPLDVTKCNMQVSACAHTSTSFAIVAPEF